MSRSLDNIYVSETGEGLKYKPVSQGPGKKNYPARDSRSEHGKKIESQFELAWGEASASCQAKLAVSASAREGVYLQIKGKAGYDLITKSLENTSQGIRLANVQTNNADEICATVFIPNTKHDFFIKKIQKYMEKTTGTDVIGTVEDIQTAMVDAFWVGKKETMPQEEAKWCEVWLRYDSKDNIIEVKKEFLDMCNCLDIATKKQHISFPERLVVGVFVNITQLADLLGCSGRIAEYRKMSSLTSFFVNMSAAEQREWSEELKNRIDISNMTNTSVCLIDTGVNNGHPLLESVLQDINKHTVDPAKGVDDNNGHGTMMAGIAEFFTLEDKLESWESIEVNHFLESVKILDRPDDNPEELYGDFTTQAVGLAEIENPDTNRAICMAITANTDIKKDGRPSSWSGAVDSIISGAEEEENNKRLMFVSAGNTTIEKMREVEDFRDAVINHSVEDPGQAWNAITVGAFTELDQIDDSEYVGYKPVAQSGDISPYTSSSLLWDHKKWPIKPEVLFEGGNVMYSEADNFYSDAENLSLLTTSNQYLSKEPFTTISMTSSATAQASWMAANIWKQYPKLRPETVRALMIHSAEWTSVMREKISPNEHLSKNEYRQLLRTCGYGVPDLQRAMWSAENSVNLIVEDELTPYIKKENGSVTSNEMHIHTLPWPKELLQQCEEANVRMRVTLSYYIEPGPGEIGWRDKYRYPSVGLCFDVNNPMEDRENFTKRISKDMREDEEDKNEIKNDSSRWLLGVNNRNVGSIHSDIWEGTASQLSESNMIIVYPKTGWWKLRTNLKKYDSTIRYSLIVTIEAPETEVDLYTAISTEIQNRTMTKTTISAL